MAERRVFAGYYKRYDGKPIFVVRVLRDIDTGEAIVVCKDASFSREDNEHYYLIRYASFCEKVEVDGELRDKYVRQTRREIDTSIVREVYEDGFPEPKSKRFTFVDDEYENRFIRCSKTYYEYAKDVCENYRIDMQRYRLIRERKQYIGVHDREEYLAMREDLAFLQQSLKTVLHDYAEIFKKRFSEGLSIRKTADALQMNRGAVERRQNALYLAFAALLRQRDGRTASSGYRRKPTKITWTQPNSSSFTEALVMQTGASFFACTSPARAKMRVVKWKKIFSEGCQVFRRNCPLSYRGGKSQ